MKDGKDGGYTPILATVAVVACVGTALKGYAAPVYEVEQRRPFRAARPKPQKSNRKQKKRSK